MARPLIKWPGGKRSELQQFITLIPDYDRYIEPFAGGAALYFYLNPAKAVLNDTSENLIKFYRLAKEQDPEMKRLLELYADSMDALLQACAENKAAIAGLYKLYAYAAQENIDISGLHPHEHLVRTVIRSDGVETELMADPAVYEEITAAAVNDKFLRTVENNRKKAFPEEDLRENLVTGFMEGFYLYFRRIFNDLAAGRAQASEAYRIANFYYIREYCYGAMFRYNKNGDFNIPYGGLTYNRKDFREKIRSIYSETTARLLGRTDIYCEDFEELLSRLDLTEKDFLFLDPPYDTEFSDYEGVDFGRKDQQRLAAFLEKTKAKFLLVIKNTDFIYQLYSPMGLRVLAFENRYLYNVKSRNDRKTQHLIITNIPEGEIPWIRENF